MALPPKTMIIQEVDVMTTFYCDRLEDEVSTKENIAGLSALQGMAGFAEEEATKVCSSYVLQMSDADYSMMSIWASNFKPLDLRYTL